MAQEEFEYKGHKVVIKLLQPLTGKWLWQISIDNIWEPVVKRAPLTYREDAIRFGTDTAKKMIDGMPVLDSNTEST